MVSERVLGLADYRLGKTSALTSLCVLVVGNTCAAEPPTFSEDVAPVLHQNCVTCHRPDGAGPFDLIDYDDVRGRAEQIADVVESGFMPPWPASSARNPPMIGERKLSATERETITQWARSGVPLGNPESVPSAPVFEGSWTLGEPDLVLELPGDYTLPADGEDIYRNFVLPVDLAESRWIEAAEFLPDSKLAIHHAVIQFDATSRSRDKDAAEPGPGFDGMELTNATNPAGEFVGWAPGQIAYQAYSGTAWELPAHADLVLQLHLLPTGKPMPIRPRIGFHFADHPPSREITYIQLRAIDIDIPAGEPRHTVRESITLPVATHLLGVYPHAHYIAREISIYALPPGEKCRWLVHIPEWDFNWQTDYRYVDPIKLPAGTELVMEIHYDNSADNIRNPSDPPQRVTLGWNSSDEMGEAVFRLLLEDEGDRDKIRKAAQDYEIKQVGGPAQYYYSLGIDREEMGRADDARRAYGKALEFEPDMAKARNNLGAMLEEAGNLVKAEASYRRALSTEPTLAVATRNLAGLLERQGRNDEAVDLLYPLMEDVSSEAEDYLSLARLEVSRERIAKATEILESSLSKHTANAKVNLQLGKLYAMQGRIEASAVRLQEILSNAAAARPDQAEAHYTLAYIALEQNRPARAADHGNAATELAPDDSEIRLLAATAAIAASRWADARRHVGRLLDTQLPPTDPMTLASALPFPEGIAVLTDVLKARGDRITARNVLDQAKAFARQQDRSDWLDALSVER